MKTWTGGVFLGLVLAVPDKEDKCKPCHTFQRTGKCISGAHCRFSHAVVAKACGAGCPREVDYVLESQAT